MESSSKVMHTWFRKQKLSSICTRFMLLSRSLIIQVRRGKDGFKGYLSSESLEDGDFFLRLAMEAFFVAHDFQGHVTLRLVVEGFYYLSERTLS